MKVYLDTSSLFKLYQREPDSGTVEEVFKNRSIDDIFISEIAKVEFVSALFKKVRMKETELADAEKAIRLFENDLTKYTVVAAQSNLLETAKDLIVTYGITGLRTLDSIQLACAIEVRDQIDKYFTSDKLLRFLFQKENLPI